MLIYVDAYVGAAGDMLLGALLDAGCPEEALRQALARLGVAGWDLAVRREKRLGLACLRADVRLADDGAAPAQPPPASPPDHGHAHGHDHPHGHDHAHGHDHDHGHGHTHEPVVCTGHDHGAHGRRLPDIVALIDAAGLPGRAAEWSRAVFRRLAEAEAHVHGTTPEEIHFHEVGAVDSIVDIVGVCTALALMDMTRLVSSPLPMGSGTVECAHGRLPVPAPAVVELMRGVPTGACDERGELTTPTGAAILVTLAAEFGPMPPMIVDAVGYGAGSRQGPRTPNVVRVVVGRAAAAPSAAEADAVWLLEANLDDATGETLGAAAQAVLAAGALDAWLAPVTMKKGRPGVILSALADDACRAAVEDTLFHETTTFGVRRTRVERTKLARRMVEVATPFGPVRVKIGERGGAVLTAHPEYDDCLRVAKERGVPFRAVAEAARAAVGRGAGGTP